MFINIAHAAADPELTNSLNTLTNFANDNKGNIINYIIGIGLAIIVIILTKKAIDRLNYLNILGNHSPYFRVKNSPRHR